MDVEAEYNASLPPETVELLTFTLEEDAVIIRPKGFLGSENFAAIAALTRDIGGEYVSAGKESHFKVKIGAP